MLSLNVLSTSCCIVVLPYLFFIFIYAKGREKRRGGSESEMSIDSCGKEEHICLVAGSCTCVQVGWSRCTACLGAAPSFSMRKGEGSMETRVYIPRSRVGLRCI